MAGFMSNGSRGKKNLELAKRINDTIRATLSEDAAVSKKILEIHEGMVFCS